MCMTCGCGEPHDDHGNPDNIVFEELRKAAEAADIPPKKALENMNETIDKV